MQPPLVVLVISAFIQSAVTSYGGATDDPIDCRIYTIGGEGTSNKTPSIPFKNNMAVSFFNGGREDNRVQTTIHLVSSSGESEPVSIFINKEAEVVLRSGDNVLGTPFSLPPPPNSTSHGPGGAWTSLVVALHDLCLVVYSQEDPVGLVMSADVNLKGNLTSFVSSNTVTYLVLDCPSGCHVHDGRSPLVDRWLPLPPYLNLFVSTTSQNGSSNFGLAFQSQTTGYAGLKKVDLDVGRWMGSPTATRQWFKVQLSRHGKTAVKISWRGNETSVNVPSGKNVFSVTNVDSVFWSLYCYPDVARGQESWIRHASPDLHDPTTNPDPDENEGDQDQGINEQTEEGEAKGEKGEGAEEEEEGNVGEGQVWAWVLTGMAFFLVMILALALCTRMRPRHEITSHGDYLPSIGIVSHRHTAEAGGREAEEMSEPGSPTIPVPVINHKLPEENDQSTKKL